MQSIAVGIVENGVGCGVMGKAMTELSMMGFAIIVIPSIYCDGSMAHGSRSNSNMGIVEFQTRTETITPMKISKENVQQNTRQLFDNEQKNPAKVHCALSDCTVENGRIVSIKDFKMECDPCRMRMARGEKNQI